MSIAYEQAREEFAAQGVDSDDALQVFNATT